MNFKRQIIKKKNLQELKTRKEQGKNRGKRLFFSTYQKEINPSNFELKIAHKTKQAQLSRRTNFREETTPNVNNRDNA